MLTGRNALRLCRDRRVGGPIRTLYGDDIIGNGFTIDIQLDACVFRRCGHVHPNIVLTGLIHLYRVPQPFAFLRVPDSITLREVLIVNGHNVHTVCTVRLTLIGSILVVISTTGLAYIVILDFNLTGKFRHHIIVRGRRRFILIQIDFIILVDTYLEPVKVGIATRRLGCKIEEAEAITYEHVERVAEAHVIANLRPARSVGAVVKTCSAAINGQIKINTQIDFGTRNRSACFLTIALFVTAIHHHFIATAFLGQGHKALIILQRHKTRNVAILHTGTVHKCTARALGAKGAHRKRILCILHAAIGATRGNTVMSRICREAPILVVRIVVELPFQRKGFRIKVIAGNHAIAGNRRIRQVKRSRGLLGSTRRLWPTILPNHGNQVCHTANRTGVTEQQGIPLAIGGVKNTTLGHTIILQKDSATIATQKTLGTVHDFGTACSARPRNGKQVILPINLFHVGAFLLHNVATIAFSRYAVNAHTAECTALAARLHARSIVVQLHIADFVSAAIKNPCRSVIIKEQRRVMVKRQMNFGPWAIFHIGSLVKVGRHCRIRRSQHIEIAIPITDA